MDRELCGDRSARVERLRRRLLPALAVLGALLAMLALTACSVSFFGAADENPYNATDVAYIAADLRQVFYLDSNGHVVRMNADGGDRRCLLEDYTCASIRLVEDTLYFLSQSDHSVYATDSSGSGVRLVCDDDVYWFNADKNALYYLRTDETIYPDDIWYEGELCRLSLRDGGKTVLYRGKYIENVNLSGDRVLFCDAEKNAVYACKSDGEGPERVLVGDDAIASVNFTAYGGKVYYIGAEEGSDGFVLRSKDLKSGKTEKVLSGLVDDFAIWNNRIVHCRRDDDGTIAVYTCSLNGKGAKRVAAGRLDEPVVFGNTLYTRQGVTINGLDYTEIAGLDLRRGTAVDVQQYRVRNLTAFGDSLFYSRTNEGDSLFRTEIGNGATDLLSRGQCDSIRVYDGKLYYLGVANGYGSAYRRPDSVSTYGLLRLDPDGRGAELIESDVREDFAIDGGTLYYANIWDDCLYCFDAGKIEDHEDHPPVMRGPYGCDFSRVLCAEDGAVYLLAYDDGYSRSTSWAVARVDVKARETDYVISRYADQVQLDRGKLYARVYLEDDATGAAYYQIIRCDTDGFGQEVLAEAQVAKFLVRGDAIYYLDAAGGCIFRADLDGSDQRQLTDEPAYDFTVDDNAIYYCSVYEQGAIYAADLDGASVRRVAAADASFTDLSGYSTRGLDDYVPPAEPDRDVSIGAGEVPRLDDPEFERFLGVMFGKEPGAVTGADLLSVRYFGYYEGAPSGASGLYNCGTENWPLENYVFYNTREFPDDVSSTDVLCGSASGAGYDYQRSCVKLSVVSNEWMAAHVFPYLYYFKNLQEAAFAYCWVPERTYLPDGARQSQLNTHGRYLHYDFSESDPASAGAEQGTYVPATPAGQPETKPEPKTEEKPAEKQRTVGLSAFTGSLYDYRTIPFVSASASSALNYGGKIYWPANAVDGDLTTSWQEDAEGLGIGEYLEAHFDSEQKIEVIRLRLGYASYYLQNGRPKTLRIDFSDQTTATYDFADVNQDFYLWLDQPVYSSYIRLTILDAYPGSKCDDTCITELTCYQRGAGGAEPTVFGNSAYIGHVDLSRVEGKYSVQCGSFSLDADVSYAENYAKRMVQEENILGNSLDVYVSVRNGYYIVCLGPFTSKEEATYHRDLLATLGYNPIVALY